jgi:hypothetical protein
MGAPAVGGSSPTRPTGGFTTDHHLVERTKLDLRKEQVSAPLPTGAGEATEGKGGGPLGTGRRWREGRVYFRRIIPSLSNCQTFDVHDQLLELGCCILVQGKSGPAPE